MASSHFEVMAFHLNGEEASCRVEYLGMGRNTPPPDGSSADRPERRSRPRSRSRLLDGFADQSGGADAIDAKPLGEMIRVLYGIEQGRIDQALKWSSRDKLKLGDVLVREGIVTSQQLSACLAVLVRREPTLLSHAFYSKLTERPWFRHARLWLESFVAPLITLGIVSGLLGLAEGGLIALFLTSAVLTTRFNSVLSDADLASEAVDILAMFTGMLAAFILVSVAVDPLSRHDMFGFVMRVGAISPSDSLFDVGRFTNFFGLLGHNIAVFFSVAVLSFVYRGYAAVLVLGWNACTWGLVLTVLTQQSIPADAGNPLYYVGLAIVAIVPHLTLEALAYICCSIATIRFSKGYLWHTFGTARFWGTIGAFATALTIAFVVLVLAAGVESRWPSYFLGLFG